MRLPQHTTAILIATIAAVCLLLGMIFGSAKLPSCVNGNMTYRQASIIIWTIALPAWFVIEDWWKPDDDAGLKEFRKNQDLAKHVWMVLGSIAAAIVGATINYSTE